MPKKLLPAIAENVPLLTDIDDELNEEPCKLALDEESSAESKQRNPKQSKAMQRRAKKTKNRKIR